MNKKLLVFSLITLMSISIVFAFTFGDVLSGRVSLFDILSGKAVAKTTCTDSDSGINYNVSGTVTRCTKGKCLNYTDLCAGTSGRIAERYCKGTNLATINYKCLNGCSNGACISNTTVLTNTTITNISSNQTGNFTR